jgi:hypothetical protein
LSTETGEPVDACSLEDEELAIRRAEWRALENRALVRSQPRPDGLLLVYRGDADTVVALERLIEAERGCCPSLDFRVDATPEEIRVTIVLDSETSGPPGEVGLSATPLVP